MTREADPVIPLKLDEDFLADPSVAPVVEATFAWICGQCPQARNVLDLTDGQGPTAGLLHEYLPHARVRSLDGSARRALADVALSSIELIWAGEIAQQRYGAKQLGQLNDILSPGGVLAMRGSGLPLRFLPEGVVPGLSARLEAALVGANAAAGGFRGSAGWDSGLPARLRAARMAYIGSRSFLLDLPAPLTPAQHWWLHDRLEASRDATLGYLGSADDIALDRLLDATAEDGVLRNPDAYILTAITIHLALRP